ncbi:MAG: hypothetical protein ACJASQ_000229 [Crocinitomicaceae bacterium]|jgi:hypothetical protein
MEIREQLGKHKNNEERMITNGKNYLIIARAFVAIETNGEYVENNNFHIDNAICYSLRNPNTYHETTLPYSTVLHEYQFI